LGAGASAASGAAGAPSSIAASNTDPAACGLDRFARCISRSLGPPGCRSTGAYRLPRRRNSTPGGNGSPLPSLPKHRRTPITRFKLAPGRTVCIDARQWAAHAGKDAAADLSPACRRCHPSSFVRSPRGHRRPPTWSADRRSAKRTRPLLRSRLRGAADRATVEAWDRSRRCATWVRPGWPGCGYFRRCPLDCFGCAVAARASRGFSQCSARSG
jgi:hypothetical protein